MLVNRIANTQQSQQDQKPIERPLKIEFLAIGGGAGGSANRGGGGGAGGLITGSFCAQKFTEYTLHIGSGSVNGGDFTFNGEDTTLFGVTALGGGGSSAFSQIPDTYPGGSGGGSGRPEISVALQPTASYIGFGNDGGAGNANAGGGGGGAGTAGGNSGANTGGNAGEPLVLDFWKSSTFSTRAYAAGGFGNGVSGNGNPAPNPDVGYLTYNMGKGGNATAGAEGTGGTGAVIIRYLGLPKAEGGSIETYDKYTYHLYTGSGDFTFKVTLNDDNFAKNNCNDGVSV